MKKIISLICVGILIFFASTIIVRFVTRQILVKQLGVSNAFTDFVFFDSNELNNAEQEQARKTVDIDWYTMYPFSDEIIMEDRQRASEQVGDTNRFAECLMKYRQMVSTLEEKIEYYHTDGLIGYHQMVSLANAYDGFIGWNFASFSEYNGVVRMKDGYLTTYQSEKDVSAHADSVIEFEEYCQNRDTDFLFVLAPCKISEREDADISGTVDFANQNANEFLIALDDADIDYLDLRENIAEENLDHHALFYRTDHHWLTTTGIWAAQKILDDCNDRYSWNVDTSGLDINNFEREIFPESFLGSEGVKVTESRTTKDDFALLYPRYDTSFHYVVPSLGIDTVGDYSVSYNVDPDNHDYLYYESDYQVCNYGDKALIQIENLLQAEDKKILIIHDSYADCVISGLALGVKSVDSIDLRYFNGSVESYIESTDPDLVIVMYYAANIGGEIDWTSHEDEFDFR